MTAKSRLEKEKAPAMPVEGGEDDRAELGQQANAGTTSSAAENVRNNPENKAAQGTGKRAEEAKVNDDPMGRTAPEETADRQADSFADEATTFTKSYLVPGEVDLDNYDHGPNKQNVIQEAINNGLRIIGLPRSDAKGNKARQRNVAEDGADDLEPNEYHNYGIIDVDDVVTFVGSDVYDFGIVGREKLSTQLTYAAEVVPAHLVGAGPTDALTDQRATLAEVVSPRHVGNTGTQHEEGLGDNNLYVDGVSEPGPFNAASI
jgi:hypothetical protein